MQLMFLYKSQKSTNMNRKIVLYVKFLNSLLHHTKLNMFWITNYLQWSRIMNFKWFLTPVKEALLEKNIKLSECKSMISFISCLSYFEVSSWNYVLKYGTMHLSHSHTDLWTASRDTQKIRSRNSSDTSVNTKAY